MRLRLGFALLLSCLLAGVILPAPAGTAQSGAFTFTLIHSNDTHSHLAGFQPTGIDCVADRPCFGGVARRKTVIDQLRAGAKNTLLLDAGDVFQGTLFYNEFKGQESVPFMNQLGYQAMAIGNHEFDDGPANLARFLKAISFPALSANVDVSAEPALQGLIKPWTIVEVGGRRVGLFGLTTVDARTISSPGPNVKFTDDVTSARAAVAALQGQGVDIIVGMTHIGYDRDQIVASQVDGIDVIVGGHSHTPLGTTDPKGLGPYPTVVKSPNGGTTVIVQAFQWGQVLGRLDVSFDEKGQLTNWSGAPIVLDRSVPEDAGFLAQVDTFAKPLATMLATNVGQAADAFDFDAETCRTGECPMGDLITDALLWTTRTEGTQIAIFNAGGLRAGLAKGNLTVGDIRKAFPFSNTVATFSLKGSDLRLALENGLSRLNAESGTGRFTQVAGMRYAFDATRPVGQRVVRAEIGTAAAGFRPIDPNATYKVVANDFMRQGGDDYAILRDKAINPYDGGALLADALAAYIAANSPIKPLREGRILAGAAAAALPAPAPAAPATTTQMPPAQALPRTGDVPIDPRWPLLAGAGGLMLAGWRLRRRRRRAA